MKDPIFMQNHKDKTTDGSKGYFQFVTFFRETLTKFQQYLFNNQYLMFVWTVNNFLKMDEKEFSEW